MRISDWSSDVCSSDLNERIAERLHPRPAHKANELERARGDQQSGRDGVGGTRNPRRERQRGGRDHRHVEAVRSEEHTSELQSLMRISYAVFCLKKKKNNIIK